MNYFMKGFAAELIKVSFNPQEYVPPSPQGAGDTEAIMKKSQGAGARAGNKGTPVATALAPRGAAAPTATTIPNSLVSGN
jgi:hypothetical protein